MRDFEFHPVPAAATALADAYAEVITEQIPAIVDDLNRADRTVEGWRGWAHLVVVNRLMAAYRESVNRILPKHVPLPDACAAYPTIEHAAFKAVRSLVHSLISEADGGGFSTGAWDADLSGRDDLIALAMYKTENSLPDLRGRIAGR